MHPVLDHNTKITPLFTRHFLRKELVGSDQREHMVTEVTMKISVPVPPNLYQQDLGRWLVEQRTCHLETVMAQLTAEVTRIAAVLSPLQSTKKKGDKIFLDVGYGGMPDMQECVIMEDPKKGSSLFPNDKESWYASVKILGTNTVFTAVIE